MSNTIVVTTDGSAHSKRVLPHAAGLASAVAARLALLTVLDPDEVPAESGQTKQLAIEQSAEALRGELATTLRHAGLDGDVVVGVCAANEPIPTAILRAASEIDAMLIAMDSRGHSAIRTVLLGATVMKVLEDSSLPLMVTGPSIEPHNFRPPYRIVVTSDGSHASAHIVRVIEPLLDADGIEVTMLRIYEPRQGDDEVKELAIAENQLRDLAAVLPPHVVADIQVRKIIPGGGVDIAIIETANQLDADAIALSAHGVSARRQLLLGSTAALLMGRSPLPLILGRAPA